MREELLIEFKQKTIQQHTYLFNGDYELYIRLLDERQFILNEVDDYNKKYGKEFNEREKLVLLDIISLDNKNKIEYLRQIEETKFKLKEINEMQRREKGYLGAYSTITSAGKTYGYNGGVYK